MGKRNRWICAAALLIWAAPGYGYSADSAFGAEFIGCIESIGVALVPTAVAQSMVPPEFHLAGEGQPVTPLVARTSRCDGISVDGERSKAGEIVQIGVVIIPPQPGAVIDTYALWYYTADAKLAQKLRKLGIDAQHVPTIDYAFASSTAATSPFDVTVRKPGDPTLSLNGTVAPSTVASGFFIANWWAKGSRGIVKMTTNVPAISIGGANLTLHTSGASDLGRLIGGDTAGFPILQQFNFLAGAHMDVAIVTP